MCCCLLNIREDGMATRQEERSHLVKAEGNFEDHPYFTVGNQRASDGVIQYSSTIRTRDGQELKQTWTVRAVQGLGLPGTLDQDVYVALLQLIEQRGEIPEDGWISFSLYELVQLLNRTHGGRDYRQIKESLDRLSGTIIQSKNAFYRKRTKSYLDDTFHLLDRVQHSESTDGSGRRADKTWVKLSDYFVESYKANYLKGLDADFYWSLSSSVAKRLYRFVDKKRNNQRRWEVDLFSLRDRIPLSPYKYPSKIREKLAPAHEELKQKGFLERVTHRKTAEGSHLVCYEIHEGFSSRRPTPQLEPSPEVAIAVERLRVEGLRVDVARDLIARHGPERCLRYAEALPFQKNLRNRAGWLRRAIEDGFELDLPPAGAGALPNGTPSAGGNGESANVADASDRRREEYGWLFAEDEPDPVKEDHSREPEPRRPNGHPEAARAGDSPHPPKLAPDPSAEGPWREALDAAAAEIDSSSLAVWLDGIMPVKLEERTLTISVPNSFAKEYIETRFQEVLERHLREQLGHGAALNIEIWGSSKAAAEQSGKPY
jgi:Replication initiator protein A/DnaA N-terminal domain